MNHVETGQRPTTLTAGARSQLDTSARPESLHSTGPRSLRYWANRDPEEQLAFDPDEVIVWPDDDLELDNAGDEQGCQLYRISEATELLLKEAFPRTALNSTRRHWRQSHGMPASDFTKCPKLDSTLKAKVPKTCKDGDRPFCKLQTLLLDAVGLPRTGCSGGGSHSGLTLPRQRKWSYQHRKTVLGGQLPQ